MIDKQEPRNQQENGMKTFCIYHRIDFDVAEVEEVLQAESSNGGRQKEIP